MKGIYQNVFATVSDIRHPRSVHNRSSRYRTTFNPGKLIPFFVELALPGDSMKVNVTANVRFASALLKPIMDDMYLETFFFAVPIRLIWPNFVKMMGERDNPDDSIDYRTPKFDVTVAPLSTTGWTEMTPMDYMGAPTKVPHFTHSSLMDRAQKKVWNDWFRHQFLQDSIEVYDPDYPDGPDDPSKCVLLDRCKINDYFSSCLPTPQGVEDAVLLPLGESAPVIVNPNSTSGAIVLNATNHNPISGALTGHAGDGIFQTAGYNSILDPNNSLLTDLSEAEAPSVNSIRQAVQLQNLFEMEALGGMRYIEQNRVMFGVISDDARLQRSEYLGGGSARVLTHPVPQTSATSGSNYQAQLAAFATGAFSGHGFAKTFKEHCIVIGFVNCRAQISYQQGCPRWFKYDTRYDYPLPIFSHVGEQAVYNYEIFAQPDTIVDETGNVVNDKVFGYQGRFNERRYRPNLSTGLFRSNATGTLDVYHLGLDFDSLPALDDEFIVDDPPIERIVAVPSQPIFVMDSVIDLIHAQCFPGRPMAGLLDHKF